MDIQIQPLTAFEGSDWEVRLDRIKVTFRTEAEARDFAETLQARISVTRLFSLATNEDDKSA